MQLKQLCREKQQVGVWGGGRLRPNLPVLACTLRVHPRQGEKAGKDYGTEWMLAQVRAASPLPCSPPPTSFHLSGGGRRLRGGEGFLHKEVSVVVTQDGEHLISGTPESSSSKLLCKEN